MIVILMICYRSLIAQEHAQNNLKYYPSRPELSCISCFLLNTVCSYIESEILYGPTAQTILLALYE
ncbi:hypothetical protein A8C56_10175 [Niabella ginsenosidivorans]|uniref:Uncharacterized protein n=1 Tax=Niabella ginsenosidivorans TaxID=1176587 RepID=A0A1A9I3K4_9BACT|nr:hypothetical protein A8C56_10175 [Niabella ginsenosidivorans]